MVEESFLSEQSVESLRLLIGRHIYTLWAPNLDAAGGHLAAWKLSMMLAKDSWVTFECEYRETPAFMLDSWTIRVAVAENPVGIERDSSGAFLCPCTISMYGPERVRAIEVFRFHDAHEHNGVSESVAYDGFLNFRCDGDKNFAIGCQLNGPGIATYLHFSEDKEVIAEMLDMGLLRTIIQ